MDCRTMGYGERNHYPLWDSPNGCWRIYGAINPNTGRKELCVVDVRAGKRQHAILSNGLLLWDYPPPQYVREAAHRIAYPRRNHQGATLHDVPGAA